MTTTPTGRDPWTKDGSDNYSDDNLTDEARTRLKVRGGVDGIERFHWKHNPLPMENGLPNKGMIVIMIILVILGFWCGVFK